MPPVRSLSDWSPRRLIAVFVIICLLPLVGLTYATQQLTLDAVDHEVRVRAKTTAEVSAASVRREMQSLAELVNSYATRPFIVEAMRTANAATYDRERIAFVLDELKAARRGIAVSFATDPSGRLADIRPATPGIVGQRFHQRDWYRGVTTTRRPYVSEAYQSAATGGPLVVAAAVLVRDVGPGSRGTGRELGILVAAYSFDAVGSEARSAAQGAQVTVTDQRGVLLSGPRFVPGRLTNESRDSVVRSALAGRSGVVHRERDGMETLRAYAPVPDIGWAVVAEVDADEAFAGSRETRRLTLLISLLRGFILLAGIGLLAAVLRARHRSEQRLRQSEERSRAIVDAADEAYIAMNADGVVTGWNSRAEETFGWTCDEALGNRLSTLIVPPQHREAHETGLQRAVETREGPVLNNRIEITALHKDGHEFPVELSIWPVWDDPDATFNAFMHDITLRRQAEVAVTERQELLAAARDAALEASELKSAFLANMSHEIRTPMNGVIGMTSLLLDTDLDERQREYAEGVRASAEALLTVINDILDFSKIEAGKLEIEHVDFRLRSVVEESAEVLADRAASKGVELAVLVSASVPDVVVGDPGRLRQLLLNLISNAVKFTEQGEVVVRVTSTTPADDDTARVRFEISDTGIGISDDVLARLFEPFSQADVSTTRRFGGTGLGLAICSQLVELMGGRIEARSRAGEGSTFSFELPLPVGASQPLESAQQLESLRGSHVLVVDDNETNRTILEEYLRSWGMTSTSYSRGADALAALRARNVRPDLALLDYHMPQMDGLELARRLSDDEALAGLPMVLLTSAAQRGDASAAAAAGIAGYLTKPVRSSQLYNMLATVLTAGARAGEPMRPRAPMVTESLLVPEGADRPRLLLAEDNDVNQTVAVRMLERIGYQVDVVGDGAAAVAALRRAPGVYAAVLMDCQMPVMDGYEATGQIRADEGIGRHTPVIAMTAGAMTGDRERCLAAGMDDYLSKPVRPDELADVLGRWVRQAGGGHGTGAPPESAEAPEPPQRQPALPEAQESQAVEEGLLNEAAIEQLRSLSERSGKPVLQEITGMFLADIDNRLARVRAAHAVGDLSELGAAAHYLKGSCGGVGAARLGAACGVIEEAARSGDVDALDAAMTELDAAAAATIPAIRGLA